MSQPGNEPLVPPVLNAGEEIRRQDHVLGQEPLRNENQIVSSAPLQAPQQRTIAELEPAYHTYETLTQAIKEVSFQHQEIVQIKSIGESFERRQLWMARVTENVKKCHNERPAVLFTGGQHGREHLSVEMCLYILRALAQNAGHPGEIQDLLKKVVVFIVFNVNPDGSEYDFNSDPRDWNDPAGWRKNRQNEENDVKINGIDLNRNWDFHWGTTQANSSNSDDYDGAQPFSAVETRVLRDFIDQQSVDGTERIRAAIDWHTFGECILIPFGYTEKKYVQGEMSEEQYAEYLALGNTMRGESSSRYGLRQAANYGIGSKCGQLLDWAWGKHQIYSFTIEMYPRAANSDRNNFLPSSTNIGRETMRAFRFVLELLKWVVKKWVGGYSPDVWTASHFPNRPY